nr:hypothetical protein [Rhodococcus fascians]
MTLKDACTHTSGEQSQLGCGSDVVRPAFRGPAEFQLDPYFGPINAVAVRYSRLRLAGSKCLVDPKPNWYRFGNFGLIDGYDGRIGLSTTFFWVIVIEQDLSDAADFVWPTVHDQQIVHHRSRCRTGATDRPLGELRARWRLLDLLTLHCAAACATSSRSRLCNYVTTKSSPMSR